MPEREAKIRYDLVVDFEEWLARCLTKGATKHGRVRINEWAQAQWPTASATRKSTCAWV